MFTTVPVATANLPHERVLRKVCVFPISLVSNIFWWYSEYGFSILPSGGNVLLLTEIYLFEVVPHFTGDLITIQVGY